MKQKAKFLMAAIAIVLSSCGFSSVSGTSEGATSGATSVDFTPEIAALELTVDYVNEDYVLPVLDGSGATVVWSCPDAEIEDGKLRYPNPSFDLTIEITAAITKSGSEHALTQPLLVKSQRNAPSPENMPQLNLTLDAGKLEADIYYEDYVRGVASLEHTVNGERETTFITAPYGIKTRGHSTRYMPKRSYRLRFDQNTSLLGMTPAKNYILLANHIDKSLIRNNIAQFLSHMYPDTLHALDFRSVELVIGDVYQGQYLMIERVEFQKNRWNIESDLTRTDGDAGFLLELDHAGFAAGEGIEDGDFFWLEYRPYYIREPNYDDPAYVPAKHTRYIKEYFFEVDEALTAQMGYSSLIDVDNFVDFFLLQEITKNVDVNWGSLYLVKETGQPLRMNPLWDFDISLGNGDYFPSQAEGHWGWVDYWDDFDNNNNPFFTKLMAIPNFRRSFVDRLADFSTRILPILNDWLDANHENWIANSTRNLEKWPLELCDGPWCPIPAEQRAFETYEEHLDFVQNYINERVAWMVANVTTTI